MFIENATTTDVSIDKNSPSVFYRELKNIYFICHRLRRVYRRTYPIDILPRVEKYLLHMPPSPTKYFQWEFFFCTHFSSVKPSVFIFTDTISNRMWNYRRTLCWRILSVGKLVGKKFTNEMAILHRRIRSVSKTFKCCSEIEVNILWKVVKITNY
jgi:hypothetical protein